MTGKGYSESADRPEDIRGEVSLVWYKESVVLILAIFSFLISSFVLLDRNLQFDPKINFPILILLFCILWFFGVFGIIFLLPWCLLSLKSQIISWRASRIVFTGTALHFTDSKGKHIYTVPFSRIKSVCQKYDNDEDSCSGYSSSGSGLPEFDSFNLNDGGCLIVSMWSVAENDQQKFLSLLVWTGIHR